MVGEKIKKRAGETKNTQTVILIRTNLRPKTGKVTMAISDEGRLAVTLKLGKNRANDEVKHTSIIKMYSNKLSLGEDMNSMPDNRRKQARYVNM